MILFVIPTTFSFTMLKSLNYDHLTNEKQKKAQILLRNVVYSSHYNERDSNEGETSVCLYACFTMVVLLRLFWQSHCVGVYNMQ